MTLNQYNEALKALESVIEHVSKSIPYKTSLDAPNSFKEVKRHLEEHGYLLIYSGSSESTIFSRPEINIMFRAIHDAGHIEHDLSFKFDDEKKLGVIQSNELKWVALTLGYDLSIANRIKAIVHAEIVGQIEYYELNSKYLEDQKSYIMSYLNVA